MTEANAKNQNQSPSAEQHSGQPQPSSQPLGAPQTAGQRQPRSGITRRGTLMPSMFSMNPRDLFTASPFELMRRFTEEMDRAFGDLGLAHSPDGGETAMWTPSVEIFERDNNLIVRAELPGLNKEDIKVEMTDDGLVIQGERKREHEERREGFYRSERSYGQFYRLIPLPEDALADQVNARFDNGVLEIVVPRTEAQQQRRSIPVETGGAQAQTATGGANKQ